MRQGSGRDVDSAITPRLLQKRFIDSGEASNSALDSAALDQLRGSVMLLLLALLEVGLVSRLPSKLTK